MIGKAILFGVLLLWVTAAAATGRDDYASQWPLKLSQTDAGAYRVILEPEVYRSVHQAGVGDLQVFNAQGQAVPTALLGPQAPLARPSGRVEVPWFALELGAGAERAASNDLTTVVQRDPSGRVLSIRNSVEFPRGTPANPTWLIDLGAYAGKVDAISFQWQDDAGPLNHAYRLEGSHDLQDWQTLQSRVSLVDLRNQGHRLRRNRIGIDGDMRYLRMVPLQDIPAPGILALYAELDRVPAQEDWRWETLPGTQVRDAEGVHYEFELDGRFPVQRVDIGTAGNDAREWTLYSRDGKEAPWEPRTLPWVAFAAGAERSLSQPLFETRRDRYWRLSAAAGDRQAAGLAPKLRLGYRPEVLVFLAQGAAPYALAAGSARTARAEAPLPQLVDAIRVRKGADWQPASATLGAMQPLAGEAALTPVPARRDWKTFVLWGVLVLGALLVAGFAFSLLRGAKPPSDPQ